MKLIRKQKRAILGTIPAIGAPLPDHFPALADYDDRWASAMTPIISAYWDDAGATARGKMGLDPDSWEVHDPKTAAKIRAAAFAFCRSTNESTGLALDDALRKLRQELAAGLVAEGESIPELTKRVRKVYSGLETWKARRIAATEAARAVHAAQQASAEEAGVVAGWEWLISGDACPLCQQVAAEVKRVRVGQAFAVIGDHPDYSIVRHPPGHPGCQCSLIPVLKHEYGGPDQVHWGLTLDQPNPGPDYEPPPGALDPDPTPRPGAEWPKVEPSGRPRPGDA